jgi:CheY-like chemotaxis protein
VLVSVTAMSDEKSRYRIEVAGFDLHLVKPVDPHKLLSVVDLAWHASGSSTRSAAGP